MSTRDLDEAVARLRAASLRNGPAAGDPMIDESAADLGPPRGRPDGAGQPIVDPDVTESRAQIGQAPVVRLEEMPAGSVVPPRRREPELDAPSAYDQAAYDQAGFDRSALVHPAPDARHAAPPVSVEPRAQFGLRHERAAPYEDEREAGEGRLARAREALGPFAARALAGLASLRATIAARREESRARKAAKASHQAGEDAIEDAPPYEAAFDEVNEAPLARHGAPRRAPLTERERRWQRRRRRHVWEEILGWILVPIILIGLYFGTIGLLAALGYTVEDVVEAVRTLMQTLG